MLVWADILRFTKDGNLMPDYRVEKTPDEWREILTSEEYIVTRERGTERAFSSKMYALFNSGLYQCVCCGVPLFDSDTKFKSRSGWPSFVQPIARNAIAYNNDSFYGMVRIEVLCNTCDSHLGHVFPDGPEPSC